MRADSKLGHISGERKAWLRILDRAGLENVRIHDLRRTMGSWQARTGASMVIIGKSLGHKSHQATAVYARLDLDPVRQSMETATSAMLEAGGLKKPAKVKNIRGAA
jgi:integrase